MTSASFWNQYQFVRHLGNGGFCQTYLVRDITSSIPAFYVVKHLKLASLKDPDSIPIAQRLFEREAQTLQQVGNHPQIPQLKQYLHSTADQYIIEEYFEGKTLEHEMPWNTQPWSEPQIIQFLESMLSILSFIHSQNIIHRDLKPANIIRRESDRQLALIDFGAVKQIKAHLQQATQLTQNQTIVGTPGYMPPEQIRACPCPASDLYALGIIAIQGMTQTKTEKLNFDEHGQLCFAPPTYISPGLVSLLQKLVRRSLEDRYQTTSDVLVDLNQLHSPLPQGTQNNQTTPRIKSAIETVLQPFFTPAAAPPSSLHTTVVSPYPTAQAPQPTAKKSRWILNPIKSLALVGGLGVLCTTAFAIGVPKWQTSMHLKTMRAQAIHERDSNQFGECISTMTRNFANHSLLRSQTDKNLLGDCKYGKAKTMASESKLREAIMMAQTIPPDSSSHAQATQSIADWSNGIYTRAEQAYNRGMRTFNPKDFLAAFDYLRNIPKNTPAFEKVQHQNTQKIWTTAMINQGKERYINASNGDKVKVAYKLLDAVPKEASESYKEAQKLLRDYKTHESVNNDLLAKINQSLSQCKCKEARKNVEKFQNDWVLGWKNEGNRLMPRVKDCETPLDVTGTLSDRSEKFREDFPMEQQTFSGSAGQKVRITLESSNFTPYMRLYSPNQTLLSRQSKNAPSAVSIPSIKLPETGTYTIQIISNDSYHNGDYQLKVETRED